MAEVKILYEDKDIIVVVKPAGMASQEERSADMDMVSWLKNYLVREKKVKGMPYIGVIHRLDKPVGGVMVYAKTQQAAGKLSEQVRGNKMTKEYLKLEKEGADFMELEKLTLGSLRKAVVEGDVVNGTIMAGQIAGMIKEVKTCKEIIEGIVGEGGRMLGIQ